MKRRQLLRHLQKHGVHFWREGRSHAVFIHPGNNQKSVIPRHTEIDNTTARKICRDLGIPAIKK